MQKIELTNGVPRVWEEWLAECQTREASDLHLVVGKRPFIRAHGEVVPHGTPVEEDTLDAIARHLGGPEYESRLEQRGSIDGAFGWKGTQQQVRFRFNIFRAMGRLAIAIRFLDDRFQSLDELGLSNDLYRLVSLKAGLLLVAGPTGSGKSTTLASFLDHINRTFSRHIITIEDPVEFLHEDVKSMVCQRQVGRDTPDFPQALMDAMRQDPDVILVGELRDPSTIRTAVLAAETGHLVLASVHAGDTAGAIERMLSVFSAEDQAAVRGMLATSLKCVIAQHLLPSMENREDGLTGQIADGHEAAARSRRVLASEVLIANSAVANLIAQGRLNQIGTILESAQSEGMYTLDHSLVELYRDRKISSAVARSLLRDERSLRHASRVV